jgi:oxygen-dependent protoporphyrinogen oxidase
MIELWLAGGIVGASTPDLLRVAIIGGGLAGLTTAYELIRLTRIDALPLEIRLYEADEVAGGTIRTERREGFLLERGADSFSTENPAGLLLAVELGLQEQLIPAHVERGVLIWWDDRCHPLPPGLSRLAEGRIRDLLRSSLLTRAGKIRASLERFEPRRQPRSGESISSFVTRRFGRQVLERVGDPLLAGFYRGDPEQLGIRYTYPELLELEQSFGSVANGRRHAAQANGAGEGQFPGVPRKVTRSPIVSFRNGMQTLVDAVAETIRRNDTGALHLGSRVRRLRPAGDPVGAAAYTVELDRAEPWTADICVIAVPQRRAASLVKDFAPEVAQGLLSVPHASSMSVQLGYHHRAARSVPDTMGCLVPHSQGRPSVACWVNHRKLDFRAPPGAALLSIELGGERKSQLLDLKDRSAVRVARKEAETLLGLKAEPTVTMVRRWPGSHPQYNVDHDERVEEVERQLDFHSGLLIAGSALYGAAIPDVIANGRATARIISDLVQTRLV